VPDGEVSRRVQATKEAAMRRTAAVIVGGAVLSAFLLAGGASGATRVSRRVFERYSPTQLSSPLRINGLDPGVSLSDVRFKPRAGEIAVDVEIEDDSETPVYGRVEQAGRDSTRFCGATDEPVEVTPGEPFVVIVYSGPCGASAGVATEGSVEVTFHRGEAAP
jgi:hypothetical protein